MPLDNTAPARLARMSLEEARSVIWPLQELKGQPMGLLFDSDLLSLKDLGFAAQRAWDWRVREAARTILLNALSQQQSEPENAPGPLNLISTERRSFAERRQLQIVMLQGVILGLVFVPLPFLIYRAFAHLTHLGGENSEVAYSSPTGIAALFIVLLFFIMLALVAYYVPSKILGFLVMDRLEKQLRLHRKGQLGEERVLNVMYGVLDGHWWLFRNVEFPGRRLGDLDLVLVGPRGVWSVEVKAYSGNYRNVGDRWEKRYGGQWHTIRKNPTRQARRNAAELSQLLGKHQIKQWITRVIVWANPESSVLLDNPSTHVWTLDQLSEHLKELSSENPLSETQIQRVVEVLKTICQEADDSIN
jgi:hypothetical protein